MPKYQDIEQHSSKEKMIQKRNTKKIKKYYELSENENATYQNL
jgi:hypothetical protein